MDVQKSLFLLPVHCYGRHPSNEQLPFTRQEALCGCEMAWKWVSNFCCWVHLKIGSWQTLWKIRCAVTQPRSSHKLLENHLPNLCCFAGSDFRGARWSISKQTVQDRKFLEPRTRYMGYAEYASGLAKKNIKIWPLACKQNLYACIVQYFWNHHVAGMYVWISLCFCGFCYHLPNHQSWFNDLYNLYLYVVSLSQHLGITLKIS